VITMANRAVSEFDQLLQEISALPPEEAAGDGEPVLKSFTAADGSRWQAYEAGATIAALTDRIEEQEAAVVKALGQVVDIFKAQSVKLTKMKAQRAQRPAAMAPDEFFSRALAAQVAGKCSGMDIAKAEACLQRGQRVPDEIVQKVLGGETYKALPQEMSAAKFLAAAEAALAAGKVNHLDVTKAQSAILQGRQPNAAFVRQVLLGHSGVLAAA
jgi:hypothetical protein